MIDILFTQVWSILISFLIQPNKKNHSIGLIIFSLKYLVIALAARACLDFLVVFGH